MNLFGGGVLFPVAVLKTSALESNRRFMRDFLAATGARLAPHGKTTMSPELFRMQLEDGAVAITLATVAQVLAARAHGVSRVLLANEVVGESALAALMTELVRYPGFELTLYIDSVEGVRRLAAAARAKGVERPIGLLLERGFEGGRGGCRSTDAALRVARAAKDAGPPLALRGVAGFEGVIRGDEAEVVAFLDAIVETAEAIDGQGLFAGRPVVLSAGGSAFFDLVASRFARARIAEKEIVLRSGCYLTHDDGVYAESFQRLKARNPEIIGGLRPALEIWAEVLSRPEPTRVIAGLGRREASHERLLPVAKAWFRPGLHGTPQPAPPATTAALNDQHALLDVAPHAPLEVGDLMGFGISHPCLTFDRWRSLLLVDDAYDVTGRITTLF
jgi:D-serine dehydratase